MYQLSKHHAIFPIYSVVIFRDVSYLRFYYFIHVHVYVHIGVHDICGYLVLGLMKTFYLSNFLCQ